MRRSLSCIFAFTLVLMASTVALAEISATSTVDHGTGEFEGYWCYTIEFSWESPQSLSHVSGFVGLDGLVCACDPGLMAFPHPAGSTTGVEDGVECTLDYIGEYLCTGDPSLPAPISDLAAVKFDPASDNCDAGSTGSGTFTFYSLIAPGSGEFHADAMVIKAGQNVVSGDLLGPLPAADCALPVQEQAWGAVKGLYRQH